MSQFGDLIPILLLAGGGIFLLLLIIKKKKGFGFKYRPVPRAEVTHDSLKDSIKINGKKVKGGTLYFGLESIHNVIRVAQLKGTKPKLSFDNKTKVLIDEGQKTAMNLMCFEVADGLLSKLFRINTDLYLFDADKVKVKHDKLNKRWFLPDSITWFSYGDIWVCEDNAKDFVRDLGFSFFDETAQTHLINTPNRVVALEIEHAKRVNIIREKVDADSGRYQPPADASETTVS